MNNSDTLIKNLLTRVKTVACLGMSPNPVRPSHFVGRYLSMRGYRVIPVNPGHAGKMLFGQEIRAGLSDIPVDQQVDMIDIFRRSEAVPAIVDEVLRTMPSVSVIWMQFGIEHPEAAAKARDHGLTVIQNRCPKIEYQRLFGELRRAGFNTGIISSKL